VAKVKGGDDDPSATGVAHRLVQRASKSAITMPFFHEDCKFADGSRGTAPRDVADAISRKVI
jgi:hypothetical protein